jgi:sterol desaturase/sphingolipid hydroxylase (fatty acid hydroxylase superfamily)
VFLHLSRQDWISTIAYVILSTIAIIVEFVIPARKVPYRRVIPLDVVSGIYYQAVVYTVAVMVSNPLFSPYHIPPTLLRGSIPLPLRVLLFYLCADCGSYWMHRLMHTRFVWRIHKFHHSPTAIWWLAGVRATIPQQILFNLPYVIAFPLLSGGPPWLFAAIVVEGIFRNHWMHLNVTWRSNWIEWIFVTPRYHHIHHSSQPEFHDTNYGSLFAIWDRLFGTYTAPDKVTAPTEFGTGDAPQQGRKKVLAVARLVAGV